MTAEVLGYSPTTVHSWRTKNPAFIAELNRRREEVWAPQIERMRALISRAVDVLAEDLDSDNKRLRQQAAIQVLRSVGLFKRNLEPSGPTDEVIADAEQVSSRRNLSSTSRSRSTARCCDRRQ